MPEDLALVLTNITKYYGGLAALTDVNLSIAVGERRALIGPNGAGKTTLFKLISGEERPTRGGIRLFGTDVTGLSAHKRIKLGLGRTYQITNVFPQLTVEQNILLAMQGLSWRKFNMWSSESTAAMRKLVNEVLERLHLFDSAQWRASELSYGQQRQLELALAIVEKPAVMLLDEPAAGLSSAERAIIADLVQSLPRTLTIVLIEHDMDLTLKLVDSVSCLHNGVVIAEDTPDAIQQNELVQSIYLGDLASHH
jgi:branched-chain amino acid transport system ATP-binding protein